MDQVSIEAEIHQEIYVYGQFRQRQLRLADIWHPGPECNLPNVFVFS
jgi:hypothetical protein